MRRVTSVDDREGIPPNEETFQTVKKYRPNNNNKKSIKTKNKPECLTTP